MREETCGIQKRPFLLSGFGWVMVTSPHWLVMSMTLPPTCRARDLREDPGMQQARKGRDLGVTGRDLSH